MERLRSPSPFSLLDAGAYFAHDMSDSLAESSEDEGYGSQDNARGHRSVRRERSRVARNGRYHKRRPARDFGRREMDDEMDDWRKTGDLDGYGRVQGEERLQRRIADLEENQRRRRS